MAILSGLFGSKKRSKDSPHSSPNSTSVPSTPESKVQAAAASPTSRPSRFASVRRKSSAVAVQAVRRQSSGDINGKKQINHGAGGKTNEWELPTLGFGGSGDEKGLESSGLGWESVGRLPSLSMEEVGRLEMASFGVTDVARIWKVLGMVLKDTGEINLLDSTIKLMLINHRPTKLYP